MAVSCRLLSENQLAILPRGQGQFKLHEPEAAGGEGWTNQSLQNPQVVWAFCSLYRPGRGWWAQGLR